ncbi:hypothetical protein QPK32_15555 [Massilia sp. YIM B02763]|uniref:hypothetical protein n=1 Tax=Massilia sp. YIM B02763 TaxID=3050130 RepID=UPI0025B6F9DE|nr:hypothetical protein [Massilia sp. YIM B02763]MDN4054498.1 hypothetical protein [Massilia sp. YIM B02763]
MKQWIAVLGLLAAAQVQAQNELPHLARVAAPAGEKVDFYENSRGCPEGGDACRNDRRAEPGEELLITGSRDEWRHAWSKGWVRAALLADVPADAQPAWDGIWVATEAPENHPARIAIACRAGGCRVDGEAKWTNGALPNGERIENLGSMQGPLRVDGNRGRFNDGNPLMPDIGCKADFVRLGRYLVVQDNGQCGGYNVRFDAVYTLDGKP